MADAYYEDDEILLFLALGIATVEQWADTPLDKVMALRGFTRRAFATYAVYKIEMLHRDPEWRIRALRLPVRWVRSVTAIIAGAVVGGWLLGLLTAQVAYVLRGRCA